MISQLFFLEVPFDAGHKKDQDGGWGWLSALVFLCRETPKAICHTYESTLL